MEELCQSREQELVECLPPPRRVLPWRPGSQPSRSLEKENTALVDLIAISRSPEGRTKLAQLRIIYTLADMIDLFSLKGRAQQSNSSSSNPSSPLASYSDEERLDNLLLLLKLTRNLCAGDATNQDAFLECHGAGILASRAVHLLLLFSSGFGENFRSEDLKPETDPPGKESALERIIAQFEANLFSRTRNPNVLSPPVSCFRMLLQLLGNFAQRGEACRAAVWKSFFPSRILELAALRAEEMRGPLCMVLYTCCQGNSQRCWDLCQDNGAALLAMVIASSVDDDLDDNKTPPISEEIDWLEILVQHLCFREPLFPVFFVNLGVPPLKRVVEPIKANTDEAVTVCRMCLESSKFTSLQASLLYVMCECLSNRASNEEEDVGGPPMPLKSLCFMADILRMAARGAAKEPEVRPVPSLTSASCTVQILGLVLSIWRMLFAWESTQGDRTKLATFLLSHGFVELLLSLLEALGPPNAPGKGETGGMGVKDGSPSDEEGSFPIKHPYLGYRRDIVAVIANLAHGNPLLQDRVREHGSVLQVLQQCVVEEESPFLREWGLWAMRNLLDGNELNQKEISQLEVKGSVNLPELQRMGLGVEIDPNTHRPHLVNESATSSQS